jgi:hypothetical protein
MENKNENIDGKVAARALQGWFHKTGLLHDASKHLWRALESKAEVRV